MDGTMSWGALPARAEIGAQQQLNHAQKARSAQIEHEVKQQQAAPQRQFGPVKSAHIQRANTSVSRTGCGMTLGQCARERELYTWRAWISMLLATH